MASREEDVLARGRGRPQEVFGAGLGAAVGGAVAGPVGAAIIGGGTSLLQNIWSARRADTAHQRQVRDLRAAGLNPMLSARLGGAEVGQQTSIGEGFQSGLQVARARAEMRLLEAQARRETSSARLLETQADEITAYAGGRAEGIAASARAADAQALLAGANKDQIVKALPAVLDKLKADIAATSASARATEYQGDINKFESMLREALVEGRVNEEEIQEFIGRLPVAWRVLFRAILTLR